jgi:hypothetical protein
LELFSGIAGLDIGRESVMADLVTIGGLAAMALSMAAEATVKGAVGEAVKDAYAALKDRVARWAADDVTALEKTPTSKRSQGGIEEETDKQPDTERETVKALALKLMEALKQEGANVPSVTVRADRGGVAAGRDMTGNTITTHSTSGTKP